ncbi:hypothetical protein CC1G_00154 [Coprinopsis cinerea okayama7|uniref:Survival motor neuron interacting protein 1 n=1 Tax=Coprinopsis cinerea (strain Okayama-7 / 130 / ATCC MYA-4618 / FGSC 9003) TaxID=240176 RepID=A8NWY5_COPC7|nr:hypothetical protein CC1G_00154 [Coprinopsis cinerea okayama7\|eukprot:XP_001837018.2 hypothetical protein CC1G_00154 [Coprinopsis cinerea okayama7\
MDISIPISGSSALKRKRDAYEDDSDDEVPAYGKQILPVASLPDDFDGEPQDGMEYLFTVRRDAQRLPEITRVPNPYETSKPLPEVVRPPGTHPSLPTPEWCELLETRFRNLRKNFNQPTIFVGPAHEAHRKYMPDKKERDMWWAYLEGKPESEWNIPKSQSKRQQKQKQRQAQYQSQSQQQSADSLDVGGGSNQTLRAWADEPEEDVAPTIIYETSLLDGNDEGEVEQALSIDPAEGLPTPTGTPGPPDSPLPSMSSAGPSSDKKGKSPVMKPREPSPVILKLIDEPTALHLLMYFTHWLNSHLQSADRSSFCPRESHARWIFALLSRIDDHISADDMNLMRNLARACIGLLGNLIERRISPRISLSLSEEEDDSMSERSCWIILAVIVHVWKQRDLWMDAEAVLARFPASCLS